MPLSRVPLTAVPQRTALSHAFGGLAAGLVGTAKYFLWAGTAELTTFRMVAIIAEVILGFLTFTGSLMAAGKLQEVMPDAADHLQGPERRQPGAARDRHRHRRCISSTTRRRRSCSRSSSLLALAFGVLLIIPIGGADMPTVISLLNSYAGLAAVAMGFVLENKLLITAGALDGSSGLILSIIMCKAMNRSFTNVLFGAFGQVQAAAAAGEQKAVKSATAEDAAQILENASTRGHRPRLRHGRRPGPAPRPRALRAS